MTSTGDDVRGRRARVRDYRLRLLDGHSERLVEDMTTATAGSTRSLRRSRLVAGLVVLPVHLLTLLSLVGGLYLLVLGHTWPERLGGVLLLLLCYGTRPEVSQRPPYVARLSAEKAPATYALVRQVGEQIAAPMPDEILMDRSYSARMCRVRLRRQVLVIGAPLWVAAPPQARVALIAHELGHLAHRDHTSGLWVGAASHTLAKWDHVFQAPSTRTTGITGRRAAGGGAAAVLLSTLVFPVFRGITGAYTALVERATAPAHRRQELLADLDAIRVGGTDGALELFDTLLAQLSVETSMSSAAVDSRRPDLWTVVRERLASRTSADLERARAAAENEHTRTDALHPATAVRIRLVKARPWEAAAVAPDLGAWGVIDRELSGPLTTAAKAIGERIRYQR